MELFNVVFTFNEFPASSGLVAVKLQKCSVAIIIQILCFPRCFPQWKKSTVYEYSNVSPSENSEFHTGLFPASN